MDIVYEWLKDKNRWMKYFICFYYTMHFNATFFTIVKRFCYNYVMISFLTLLKIHDTFIKVYNFHDITLPLNILSGFQIVQHGVLE
jgi:hypothetical protein